jgi:rare lipoprotein A
MNILLSIVLKVVIALSATTQVSYYGQPFHGHKTASGELFNMHDLTCASPTLPFGTQVLITNPANGKSVTVRVNDRGPFAVSPEGELIRPLRPHPTRSFDLSQSAFDSIANISAGVVSVDFTIIK